MKDGHSVEEPQPRRRQRPPAPSAQNIAGAHGRQVACWVCDGTEMLERAHIVPWVIDPRNDPLAYVLLCEAHHEDAPDLAPRRSSGIGSRSREARRLCLPGQTR